MSDSKKKKKTARLVTVTHCAECPLSYELDGEWTCTGTEDKHGLFKTIERVQKPRGAWLPPPKWCPLREEIVIVAIGDMK